MDRTFGRPLICACNDSLVACALLAHRAMTKVNKMASESRCIIRSITHAQLSKASADCYLKGCVEVLFLHI